VIVLLGIGLVAGLVTALSPCVLPVLPVLLAGGATGRRPLLIIAGLISSFVTFTLVAAWLLRTLGLPLDLLRNIAIALLFVVAATLVVPAFARWLERPLARLTRLRPTVSGGGFLLGASLGLVFVPCAGPVLAAISVVAANDRVGWRAILLTTAYAVGAAIPMLVIAYGGRAAASRFRTHAAELRLASGIVIGIVALGLALNQDTRFTTLLPGYTSALQKQVEDTSTARRHLAQLTGEGQAAAPKPTAVPGLPDYGLAHALVKTGHWFNSPPLTMSQLRGKVVLLDFWTYSCVNCLRTIPHLEGWYNAYKSRGLVVLGVHTPEFAFEHVASNVGGAIKRLGIHYPVVQDNDYGTWNAYKNQYWPGEYLIDRTGHIRYTHFGESSYDETEGWIRLLLGITAGKMTDVPDLTPVGIDTPESYLGYYRLERYAGSPAPRQDVYAGYAFPRSLPPSQLAYAGHWDVESQRIVAGAAARLRLHFIAQKVYLVLGGPGHVSVLVNGKPSGRLTVDGYRLYTILNLRRPANATLELRFSKGVKAYAFTFG
jgi:cytochrome c biogenesis protein CcdA/thiol-disulfide isomerase/thioredoxin